MSSPVERGPREQALDVLLEADGALDAADVAERLGVHVTTARFHLDHLARLGLAQRRADATGRRGRPRILFSPAPGTRAERSREQLIDVLAAALGRDVDAAAEAVRAGGRWADALTSGPPAGDVDAGSSLVDELDALGFAPESVDGGIRLAACPFRDAARAHPEVVCAVHRGLVERLVATVQPERTVRLLPFVEPQVCMILLGPQSAEAGATTG